MSEPKAEYETGTDDSQPTQGPWVVRDEYPDSERYTFVIQRDDPYGVGPWNIASVYSSVPPAISKDPVMGDAAEANARLIAAAGTAASELPDDIDPVAAIKALPSLIRAARQVQRSQEPIHPRSWERLGNALAKAKGKSGMTL